MAFFSKVRGVLQHNIAKNMGGELSAPTPAIFQALRCMSSKIFVGGLSYQTTEETLRQTCEKYGPVYEARIIVDRDTGNSRGFGFITFDNDEAANSAIMALDNQELDGRRLKVNHAHDRTQSFGGGGRGYNDRGNFGGGGGYNNYGNDQNQAGGQGNYGGGGYNQGGGGYDNQGGGGYDNQGGGGYDNQASGGYDNQASGGYNSNPGGGSYSNNSPYHPGSYSSTGSNLDLGGNNAFEGGNASYGVGNNQNYGVPGSVDNGPGLSYGGGDQSINGVNNDFPSDNEADTHQERRAS